MECPHCNYREGWGWYTDDDQESVYRLATDDLGEGLKGRFFSLSNQVTMTRTEPYTFGSDKRSLLGCPCCNKLFMTKDH